ncbi:MAG: DapH/DapD/GlmU-related protein [Anaerolineae bacterium]
MSRRGPRRVGPPAPSCPHQHSQSSQRPSPLTIGDETSIGTGAVVYTGTTIGRQCLVGDLAFVREQVQIGDRVIVGTHVTIENAVSIGDNVKMQTGAYITAWTTIEADCFIAPCVVTTNDNYMGRTERRFAERGGAVIRRGAARRRQRDAVAQRRGGRGGLCGRRLGGQPFRPAGNSGHGQSGQAAACSAGGRVCWEVEWWASRQVGK